MTFNDDNDISWLLSKSLPSSGVEDEERWFKFGARAAMDMKADSEARQTSRPQSGWLEVQSTRLRQRSGVSQSLNPHQKFGRSAEDSFANVSRRGHRLSMSTSLIEQCSVSIACNSRRRTQRPNRSNISREGTRGPIVISSNRNSVTIVFHDLQTKDMAVLTCEGMVEASSIDG